MKQLWYQLCLYRKKMEARWGKLSLQKQHNYIRVGFTVYLIITFCVFADIFLNGDQYEEVIEIDRIENPTLRKSGPRKLSIDTIFLFPQKQRL